LIGHCESVEFCFWNGAVHSYCFLAHRLTLNLLAAIWLPLCC
jgi:hypothetical protein